MSFWKKMFGGKKANYVNTLDNGKFNSNSTLAISDNNIEEPSYNIETFVYEVSTISIIEAEPLDLMKVKYDPSPNKSNRKGEVKCIVLHHTGPGSFNGIVKWLCDSNAKASAHYVLGTSGQLKQLVNTRNESWHAGVASIDGKRVDNHHSIGIEVCNYGVLHKGNDGNFYYEYGRQTKKYTGKVEPVPGTIKYPNGSVLSGYYVPYPEKQLKKLVSLCKALVVKYPEIGPEQILMHYEIAWPEGRKNDPFGLDVELIRKSIFSL